MEISPDEAVRAIKALTDALNRLGRVSGIMLILIGLILLSSTVFFVIGVRTHAAQNEALTIILNQNRLRGN